ncbi:MAG: N-acetyltransferase [Chloroflexi bacterium]|nr:MAG: N-acetyltransferase [Chloroflexota bacterium]
MCDEDMAFLCQLYATTRDYELNLVAWSETQKAEFLSFQFEAQHKHYMSHWPDADYLIIEQDEQAIGRYYLHRRPDEFRLIDIALMPTHRNQGLGGAIMCQLLQEAQQAQLPVRLHVEYMNPARRFYARLGFYLVEDKGIYHFMEWSPTSSEGA